MKNIQNNNNEIHENEAITLNHILAIILYCDHQTLYNSLRKACKAQNNNNNDKVNEFSNWYKYLMQAVELFGNALTEHNTFYYCFKITCASDELNKCYFRNFSLKLNAPTSTTGHLNVAIASCNEQNNGVILKLEKHFTDGMSTEMGRLRYVDCSLFSYHSNEDEKLFAGGLRPLKIANMIFMNTFESYEPFIYAITLLDEMLGGANSGEQINKNYIYIIDSLLRPSEKNTFPVYINNIFKSFCKNKKEIKIDLNGFRLLSDYLCSEDHVVSIANITKLFPMCVKIEIINNNGNDNIDISYLTQLFMELTTNNEFVVTNTALNEIVLRNIQMDNDKMLEHYKKDFGKNHLEFIMNINDKKTYDITIKTEKLTETDEYKEIYQYVQDELAKLLILPTDNNHNDHTKEYHEHQEYKTANDILIECTVCNAAESKRVYTHCESVKRMKIVLTAYKKLIQCPKLWRNVSLQEILTFNDVYTLTQFNDDFIHIKEHIDASEEHDVRINFQNEINCETPTCWGKHRGRRQKFIYPKSMGLEDIVFQETCDKIHKYMIHPQKSESDDRSGPNGENNDKKSDQKKGKGYIGKKEDEEWWDWKDLKIKEEKENYDEDDEADAMIEHNKDEDIYRHLINKMNIFRWQQPHGFTNEQHQSLMHLKPKYKDVKEEALNNKYYKLSKDNWNQTLRKSHVFFNSFAKKKINTLYPGKYDDIITNTYEEWRKGVDVDMKEIVTLKLYTDFDKLQYELKRCFRFDTLSDIFTLCDFNPVLSREQATKSQFDENEKQKRLELEHRLCTFYWWRIKLLTVLNKFGKRLDPKIPLFHGVNGKMILNNGRRQNLAFYGPLSTSASYHVARTFATAKGMVLQVTTQFPKLTNNCRAFDASLISDYPEEKEWLIGFLYLRIKKVLTRPLNKNWKSFEDIDDPNNYYHIPLSSQTRSIFFAVHLFRQQLFSMSVHSEYYLAAFLYLQGKWDEDEENNYDNNHIQSTKFSIKLQKAMGNNRRKFNNKKTEKEYKTQTKILKILYKKFENFRKYPNWNQVVVIDEISDNLKPYFMDFDTIGIRKQEKYVLSISKIVRIFENVKEIRFINNYAFDVIALQKLVWFLERHSDQKEEKLQQIKFLYYDCETAPQQNNDGSLFPVESQVFYDPKKLDKQWLNRLKEKKWEIKHKNIGKTGYQIQLYKIHSKGID